MRIVHIDWLVATDFDVARVIVQRGVALTYVIAFVNVRNQFRPLLGEQGLLPVPAYVARTDFAAAPSIFQWHYSDRILAAVAWGGAGLPTTSDSTG